ncbi:MAG: GNAT family N-acetyltransferase [Gemmatimonadetes bacterium]|jgi:predicted N-acetyltransferase YhbS|nr:GNAT family N-acetyltransferase [Gemmatimonadota bacterium]MBT6149554.1 GNAT family N-acetyltransferase [Gemmatimonadota bacterium]MBT7864292.1 GNAT family N-acetyltransferase [Gemmatimonadota bacterium]
MAQFTTPRIARLEEFDEAMAFTDRVFRPGQRGRRILQRQYPHVYRETAAFARRLLLLRDAAAADALVGCVGMHPMKLRLGAATVSASGIGIVGADPDRRGEGIMTRLLEDALVRMREAGHVISILGGDRQRYGWFGWENGGIRHRYTLTSRMLGAPTPAERSLSLERFDPDDAATRRRLHDLDAGRAYGVEHATGDVAPLYHRVGREAWVIREGKRFACLCLSGPQRRPRPYETIDAALGDPELVISGLRCLMARFRRPQLTALAGPNTEESALFDPWAASWSTDDDMMIRILDLPGLVSQIEPEMRRLRRVRGVRLPDLRLELTDLNQMAVLPGGGARRRRLALTSTQAVQWLFGSRPLATTGLASSVGKDIIGPWSALLPLPLHVPPLHHI